MPIIWDHIPPFEGRRRVLAICDPVAHYLGNSSPKFFWRGLEEGFKRDRQGLPGLFFLEVGTPSAEAGKKTLKRAGFRVSWLRCRVLDGFGFGL